MVGYGQSAEQIRAAEYPNCNRRRGAIRLGLGTQRADPEFRRSIAAAV